MKCDLDWFQKLRDDELIDIAYLEATVESHTSKQVRDLLVALAERLRERKE